MRTRDALATTTPQKRDDDEKETTPLLGGDEDDAMWNALRERRGGDENEGMKLLPGLLKPKKPFSGGTNGMMRHIGDGDATMTRRRRRKEAKDASLRAIDVQPVVRFGVVEIDAIDGRKGENNERYEPELEDLRVSV